MSFSLKNSCIHTERLELFPQSIRFLETTHAYASDKENMRFVLHLPNDSLDETRAFLLGAEAEWKKEVPDFFEFAILREGKHIGGVSLYLEDDRRSAELGWCLDKSAQGKGYGAEAARALIEWAQKELSVNRFIAHCDSENIASWKTMEKLGMKRISCTGGRYNKSAPEEERQEFLYEMW